MVNIIQGAEISKTCEQLSLSRSVRSCVTKSRVPKWLTMTIFARHDSAFTAGKYLCQPLRIHEVTGIFVKVDLNLKYTKHGNQMTAVLAGRKTKNIKEWDTKLDESDVR